MIKWIFRSILFALAAWAWRTYRDRRAETERSGARVSVSNRSYRKSYHGGKIAFAEGFPIPWHAKKKVIHV
jgi:hypothetical protein